MNWFIFIPFCVIAIGLVVYLVIRNLKDEKIFEKEIDEVLLNKKNEGDIEIGEG